MSFGTAGLQLRLVINLPRALHRFTLYSNVFNHNRVSKFQVAFGITQRNVSGNQVYDGTPGTKALVQKYPPGPLDTAIFEDVSDEYSNNGEHPSTLTSSDMEVRPLTLGDTNPCAVLARLIEKGDFTGAQNAKDELVALQIPIHPDRLYAKAALYHLRNTAKADRARYFITWWELSDPSHWMESIPEAEEQLLKDLVDIALIVDFILLCTSRGFSPPALKNLFAHVIRFADLSLTESFLQSFENFAKENPGSSPPVVSKDRMVGWRNIAIRTHALAGRTMLAAELLERCHAEGIRIESITHRLVLEKLVGRNLDDRAQRLRKLIPSDNSNEEYTEARKPALVDTMDRHGMYQKIPSPHEMATALRFIRRIIRDKSPPPFAAHLANFMFHYDVFYKRRRAIRSLQRIVFGKVPRSVASQFVAAQQLYYTGRRRPIAVLRTFLHYFPSYGVPADHARALMEYHDKEIIWRQTKHSPDCNSSKSLYPITKKLWPAKLNVQLAWKALVQLTKDREIMERLYRELLTLLKHAQNTEEWQPGDGDGGARNTPSWSPDVGFFQPFIVAFGSRVGPQRAALVISDMRRHGLRPSKDNWAVLAAAFARAGDVRKVMTILSHMEETFINPSEETLKERWKTISTYNSVIRGLTESGQFAAARSVQRRMQDGGYFDKPLDRRTKAILHRLSRYEKGKFSGLLSRRKTMRNTDGQIVYAQRRRAQWNSESDSLWK
ncbi:hypothetical protein BD410DRAFT_201139 [Rickenella mellea]|uniref:Pentacotripeptide-repeat region of PRORP domain-containing protein n=1 Tax=Rickenella mellea TaxID=50990 RepID=A0A4Y7Q5J1_9AGAM|nr:hypothetical protein BD410DRAFT_201139 [Rickenella mellea]